MTTTIREYRVVGMSGRPATSNTYSTAILGWIEARAKVLNVQGSRGGKIQTREIIVEDWHTVDQSEELP